MNIFLDAEENALLADFGISVIDYVGSSMTKEQRDGAIAWKAPELLGDPMLDDSPPTRANAQSDAYAFGCVCVEV